MEKRNKQVTFTDVEYSGRRRMTKREEFLDIMDEIIPWEEWIGIIEPHYYDGKRGRRPRGIETMLRMYLLQNWFNLSDEAVEDSICDSYAMRKFMKIDFCTEQAPDATTLLKFRRIIVDSGIGKLFFDAIKNCLARAGRMMSGGTIVDATIISAPSSTKNAKQERDPEMHSTKKGNQWYFGMKTHAGVDAGSGYVHTIEATGANVHDIEVVEKLVRKDDEVLYGDSAYISAEKRIGRPIESKINRKRGKIRKMPEGYAKQFEQEIERRKSSVRSKVEYVFLVVKRLFHYAKVRYKGLKKNLNQQHILFGSANLLMFARSRAKSALLTENT
jgi:IS5 family transposase